MSGCLVSGPLFVSLAEYFISMLNTGNSISIPDAFGAISLSACERANLRCIESYDEAFAQLKEKMPLDSSEISFWLVVVPQVSTVIVVGTMILHMTASRDTIELYKTLTIGLQVVEIALRDLEEKIHSNAYQDFGEYDRDRRRVRAKYFELAPKHPSALIVLHEFMEDVVCSVAKRFINKLSLQLQEEDSRNACCLSWVCLQLTSCDFRKEFESQQLKLEVSEMKHRANMLEKSLHESQRREKEAREVNFALLTVPAPLMFLAKETLRGERGARKGIGRDRTSDVFPDVAMFVKMRFQVQSRVLKESLSECEDVKRMKSETELQLTHAMEKIEELTEWKQVDRSSIYFLLSVSVSVSVCPSSCLPAVSLYLLSSPSPFPLHLPLPSFIVHPWNRNMYLMQMNNSSVVWQTLDSRRSQSLE
eukprot:325949-Hanusia_phi.AAC.1